MQQREAGDDREFAQVACGRAHRRIDHRGVHRGIGLAVGNHWIRLVGLRLGGTGLFIGIPGPIG
jgi:hypothetical protein